MILTIDIGNTNITLGGFLNEKLTFTSRMATDKRRTKDQYAVEISAILKFYGVEKQIKSVCISSVVPEITDSFRLAFLELYGINAVVIGPGVKTGLNIKIDNPATSGADLVAGAVGATAKYETPLIIVDMGTATTLSAVNKNGEFIGGAIAAGVGITLSALTANTSLLPSINVTAPKKAIGSNTVECMQSGIIFGSAGMIDGLIDRFKDEMKALGENEEVKTVVATGGRAEQIVPFCKNKIVTDNDLLLTGLLEIYKRNKN